MFYEIDNSLIQQEDPNLHAHWFRDSRRDRDLFVWKDDNRKIVRVQLSYNDIIVEWDKENGVRTGRLYGKGKLSAKTLSDNHD